MKRFLTTIILFGCVLLGALVAGDFLLSRYMRDANTYGMETWKDIMEGQAAADILVMGDSRALNSSDRAVLDSLAGLPAYNLAIIGNPFAVQHFRYRMYRQHNPAPRFILQYVDDFLLGPKMSLDDPVQFLPWMWDASFRKGMSAFGIPVFFREGFPLFRYQGSRPWVVGRHRRVSENGFFSYDDKQFHAYPTNWYFRYREDTDGRFREFLRQSREEGIRVALVFPPLHESVGFREGERERMCAYYDKTSAEFGIPFFDGCSLSMVHDSTFFMDPGHLNEKGARAFTDSLTCYLNGIGFFD